MSSLYVANNLAFETTENNQIQYIHSNKTLAISAGGANVIVANSNGITVKLNSNISFTVDAGAGSNNVISYSGNSSAISLFTNGQINYSGFVTTANVFANTADWSPNFGNAYLIRVSTKNTTNATANDFPYFLYGMTAGTNGQIVVLNNIGTKEFILSSEDAANQANAVNRFSLPNNITVRPYASISLIYDGISQRWKGQNTIDTNFIYKAVTKGFSAGGQRPAAVTTADRTTYSTETTAAVVGADLTQARLPRGAGNISKAFFVGGTSNTTLCSRVTTADRTTYSSETTAAVPGADLSQARGGLSGAGNACKGFFAGGITAAPALTRVTTADRTTYSTETTAAVVGANLTQARNALSATGNACKGFFAGGTSPIPVACTRLTTVCRNTYSTETNAAVPGANLTQGKGNLGSIGNSCKGFFAGGLTPTISAGACRITYSTETTAAVTGANLSQARINPGPTGDACKGFFNGGSTPTCTFYATSDRTTYSTETTAAVPGANLTQTRSNMGAA